MTENEFIHIVPQLRQITLQVSQGYGVGCDEAEDIAQDAMLKLWAIKDDIQSAAHAKGSMGCIAKHLCIDFFRKRKMISIDAQPFDKSPSHYAPPDVEVENSENEQWLQKRLKALPSNQYQVLYLRQVEKKSSEEIAQIVGITPESVSVLLSRARKQMLQEIRKRCR